MQCCNKKIMIWENQRQFYNNESFMTLKRFKNEYNVSDATIKQYNNKHWYVCSCGECRNCLINKRYFLQKRLENETLEWRYKVFITLTYNDLNNPYWLIKKEVQNFVKYLRKEIKGIKIKYFAAGEYGDRSNRPHYHLIIFTNDFKPFAAGKIHIKTKNNTDYFFSPLVNKCWKSKGFNICTIDQGYVNKYVLKYTTKSNQKYFKYIFKRELNNFRTQLYESKTIKGFELYAAVDHWIQNYNKEFEQPAPFYLYSKSLGYVNMQVDPDRAPKYQLKKYLDDYSYSIVKNEKTLNDLYEDAAYIYYKNNVSSLYNKEKNRLNDLETRNINNKSSL